jgi:hypothetical protein
MGRHPNTLVPFTVDIAVDAMLSGTAARSTFVKSIAFLG